MTAAEMAAALGVSPQAIRKQLRSAPTTGKRAVAGNVADTWGLPDLPAALRSRLEHLARSRGYPTAGEMFAGGFKAWQPPIPLAEISCESLTEADKVKRALLPSLRRRFVTSQGEFERDGVADYEKIFGRKISTRHFRGLIKRTVERDGGLENWERLALYLPAKPKRKRESIESKEQFPGLVDTINAGSTPDEIWKKTFQTFADLVRAGKPRNRIARQLRACLGERAPSLAPSPEALRKAFDRKYECWQADEPFDKREDNGAEDGELATQIKALDWFIPAARFFYLLTNRTQNTGSTPEAVLTTISLPNLPVGWPESLKRKLLKAVGQKEIPSCPVELREAILARQKNYLPLVPASIAKKIMVNKGIVQFYRSPKEWRLANLSAPGTQRCYSDSASGRRVPMRPGDWFGGDDATPGIAVCVPCDGVATPSSEKFGVLLGRFQWLAYQDCRTDKILAWDYVVRPRGSYRAEDILNGMGAVVRTHGIPRQGFQFEGGTFNAKLVQQAIKLLGCEHWRTYSPHAKAIESVFNRVWTGLAVQFPHADMGRYRNENEANCKLYEACKRGHKDPRRYFPTLDLVTKVFVEVVTTHNVKPINSKQYGRWVPDESFARDVAKQPLREFSSDMDWIFSPFAVERTVRGMMVSCKVPMFEDFSVPFEFSAAWLPMHDGKKVRMHFDPRKPQCVAKVVLLQASDSHTAGEVLGDAQLIGETSQYIRFMLDQGDPNQRAGYIARQKAANFMRRETRGIGAGGRVEYFKSEERDGISQVTTIQRDGTGKEVLRDGKEASTSRLMQRLLEETADDIAYERDVDERATRRASQKADIEKFERENQHLLV